MEAGKPADIGQQERAIRAMFSRVAARYDVINRWLSLGRDQHWRKQALAIAQIPAGGMVLDVATGTGDMAFLAQELAPTARVIGADLTPAMLYAARRKAQQKILPLALSDGLALSFADAAFDVVTSAFMMRNVPDVGRALAEQYRVTRPGGRMVCLELTWPRRFPMNALFRIYFFRMSPLLGRLLLGEREPYDYLPQSVLRFLTPEEMAAKMEQVGFRDVAWTLKMLGTVAIHTGVKPVTD